MSDTPSLHRLLAALDRVGREAVSYVLSGNHAGLYCSLDTLSRALTDPHPDVPSDKGGAIDFALPDGLHAPFFVVDASRPLLSEAARATRIHTAAARYLVHADVEAAALAELVVEPLVPPELRAELLLRVRAEV